MSTAEDAAPNTVDFVVIGGGIAGASVAYWLAPHGRVALLERESQPGYHSTGRSAALYMPSYGPPQVRALTCASRAFFEGSSAGFSEHAVLSARGALMVAAAGQEARLDAHWEVLRAVCPDARRLTPRQACSMVPALREDPLRGAVFEPDAFDMDVHAIHQGFLRGVRVAGSRVVCDAEVTGLEFEHGRWQLQSTAGRYVAPVVVNAAGAWVDEIARLAGVAPIGIEPRRRSAFTFSPPAGLDTRGWPMVIGADEDWYLKPDAGMLLGSPANADPVGAHDVQPEELDIALAIDRIEAFTTLRIRRPTRTWAGLRSFVADGDLVGGFDDGVPGFFWLAAQGGYGIQTSPAMGQACAALARGRPIPDELARFGVCARHLSPARLRNSR